jgi:hypothetical protein
MVAASLSVWLPCLIGAHVFTAFWLLLALKALAPQHWSKLVSLLGGERTKQSSRKKTLVIRHCGFHSTPGSRGLAKQICEVQYLNRRALRTLGRLGGSAWGSELVAHAYAETLGAYTRTHMRSSPCARPV